MSPSKISQIRFDEFHNIVDGKQRGASDVHNGINPVTQEKLWDVPVATQQDVDDAVAAGAKAFKSWSKTTIEERKAMIQKFNDLYAGYQEEMTDLLAAETGKPVRTYSWNTTSIEEVLQANNVILVAAICGDGSRKRWNVVSPSL